MGRLTCTHRSSVAAEGEQGTDGEAGRLKDTRREMTEAWRKVRVEREGVN